MKILIIVSFTALVSSVFAQPPVQTVSCPRTETTVAPSMDPYIQKILGDAQTVNRIGELPNGDVIFFVSGIWSDTTQWEDLGNGIKMQSNYLSHECLLIKSKLFQRWELLAFNPSSEGYTMRNPGLNKDWEIETLFTKGEEKITASYSLKQKKFVFKSNNDREKIAPWE